MWSEGYCCQRFFEYPGWKRLFEVRAPESQPAGVDENAARLEKAGEQLLEKLAQEHAERRQKRKVTVTQARSEANSWLEHRGWAKHLAGFEKVQLRQSLQPAGPETEVEDRGEEEALELCCQRMGKMILKAMKVCNPNTVPRSALMFVNRRESGVDNNEKPFYSAHKAETMRQYSAVWTKILRYVWRSQTWKKRPNMR